MSDLIVALSDGRPSEHNGVVDENDGQAMETQCQKPVPQIGFGVEQKQLDQRRIPQKIAT